jgi:hypothetical protein
MVLQESWAAREAAELALPPSFLALEPGDVIALALHNGMRKVRIEEIADGALRKIRGRSFDSSVFEPAETVERGGSAALAVVYGPPAATLLDLPLAGDTASAHAPWIAAAATPWPGALALNRRSGPSAFSFNRLIETPATMGFLTSALARGPLHAFDRANAFTVRLTSGALSSAGAEELLQGANAAAVGSPETGFEIIQFAEAQLVAPDSYRISFLLRGERGSSPEMAALRPAGQRFVLLDEAVVQPELALAQAGLPQEWRIGPAQYDLGRAQLTLNHTGRRLGLRPLSPCHARAVREGGDVVFSWIRRSRIEGDGWDQGEIPLAEEQEAYRVEIMHGAAVKRAVTVNAPRFRYAAAQIAVDFGADPRRFTLRVAQVSTVFGPGAMLERTIDV